MYLLAALVTLLAAPARMIRRRSARGRPVLAGHLPAELRARSGAIHLVLATALLLATTPETIAVGAVQPAWAQSATQDVPVVGGQALAAAIVSGVPLYYDADVPPPVVEAFGVAVERAFADVPRLTGLGPPRSVPTLHLLATDQRFKLAINELAGVRAELIDEDTGAYAIEREGRTLLFFQREEVQQPSLALLELAHELTHALVREASERRAIPQWLNEGYASWVSETVLASYHPDEASTVRAVDQAVVASALHTRGGLLPWADLVTRAEFGRAGSQGLGTLAYGQSTLFVDWLVERHGPAAPADFWRAIGRGRSTTQAFDEAFGSYAVEARTFAATLPALAGRFPAGLHSLSPRVRVGGLGAFAVVGGDSFERPRATVETERGGEERELELDGVGFGMVVLEAQHVLEPGRLRVEVSSVRLGTLAATTNIVASGEHLLPAPAPTPVPVPVQIPRFGDRREAPLPRPSLGRARAVWPAPLKAVKRARR